MAIVISDLQLSDREILIMISVLKHNIDIFIDIYRLIFIDTYCIVNDQLVDLVFSSLQRETYEEKKC